MRIFSPRKTRNIKAATLTAGTRWSGRLLGRLRDVDVLLRLAVSAVFLCAFVVVLESWRAPFRFRVGEHLIDGILARIDFERINQRKTELARLERERLVAPVFRHDVHPLLELENQLREDLFSTVAVHDINEISADVRSAFGFNVDLQGAAPLPPALARDWQTLQATIGPASMAERQITDILGEFSHFISILQKSGVLNPEDVSRLDLTPDRPIALMTGADTLDDVTTLEEVKVADTLLQENLKAGGLLARAWNQYPLLARLQPTLERWLQQRVPVTLTFDEVATNRRLQKIRKETPNVTDNFKRGQVLVPPGSSIDEETLEVLRAQYQAIEGEVSWTDRVIRVSIVAALLLVLGGVNAYYLSRNEPRLINNTARLTIYLAAIVLAVGLGRVLAAGSWRAEVMPLLAVVMVLAIAYNQVLAALTGFSLSLLLTLSTGGNVGDFVLFMSAIAAAVVQLNQVASRSKVVIVGFWTAVTYLFVAWGVAIIDSQRLNRLWTDWTLHADSLSAAGWCFATGFLVAGSMPFIEKLFGVVTDISLLELSDISHPLLQELVRRAPGTYNHSISVATISETAADAIGANGLLCRVGAYFHDIGKMLKPQYFVENMTAGQTSRHDQLNPAMSTLIIIGHVKDGVDLASQHNLPQPLVDFIEQHHGTTLVEFFYRAATKQATALPEERRPVVEESAFRYPGPKPQTREAAVMMIADAVEGASRTLSEPTPKRIETLVHDISMKRLLDGQFDECSLTLSELAVIEDSLTKSLIGIYHGRIKYPDQKTA
ncbi:MAG: HDIG domain-containing protein [Planctomycetaceae bacterium]|nr:HDIG domain-containing protein [Planctomycetaceae bacterium]